MYYINKKAAGRHVILLSSCMRILLACVILPRNTIMVALAPFLLRSRAELEYSVIRESLNWRAEDGAVVIHRGPLNPMLGFLLNKVGIVHNKRFFAPENDPELDKTTDAGGMTVCTRRYNKDRAHGENAFFETFLRLFPSSSGRVSIGMTRRGSFCYELRLRERSVATRFVAALAAMSLGTEIGYKHVEEAVIIETSPEVRIEGPALHEVAGVVKFFASAEESKDYLKSRMFLLQVFMFHFFDTEEEVRDFFTHVHGFMGDRRSVCFTAPGEESTVDYTLLDKVVDMNRIFPFSLVNPLPVNVSVPLYSRATGIVDDKYFSDCGEVALLGLLCCLLYDSDKKEYTTKHLKGDDLKEFFVRHSKTFAITTGIRREWLGVVEGLSNEDIVYVKSYNVAKENKVGYEIKSGLINMLVILKHIARLKRNFDLYMLRAMDIPSRYSDIREMFERAFQRVISELSTKRVKCEFGNLRVEKIRNKGISSKWDVFGTVVIEIPVQDNVFAELEVSHSIGHSEVRMLQYPTVLGDDTSIVKKAKALITPECSLESLIGRYAYLSLLKDAEGNVFYRQVSKSLKKERVSDVFIWGILDTDRSKCRLLDALFPYTMRNKEHAVRIAHNVISGVALNDKTTCLKYAPFVMLDRSLRGFKDALNVWWKQAPRYKVTEWAVRERYINVACYCIHIDCDVREIPSRYDLLYLLVQHGRAHSIGELVGLYGRPVDLLVEILYIGVRHSFVGFTNYFFREIQKEDLEKCEHFVEDVEDYLEKHALHQDTSLEDLEKIYYWFFSARYLGYREQKILFRIVLSTHTRVGTDFLYDCIVRRCPNFHGILHFYKAFLDFAISNQVKVRNDVLFLLSCIFHTFSGYTQEELDDEDFMYLPYEYSKELVQELSLLLDIAKRELMEDKASFSKKKYETFIVSYITSMDKNTPQKYIDGVKHVFEAVEEVQDTCNAK